MRVFAQLRMHASQATLQHEAAAFEHQRVRDVVDVLRRAGEVDELRGMRKRRHILRATPDEVLDSLDVVIGLGLDRLDLGAVVDFEVDDQLPQPCLSLAWQARQLRQAEHRQVDEPLDLDAQPLAHEGKLGKHLPQLGRLSTIAAVERREGGQGKQFERHDGSAGRLSTLVLGARTRKSSVANAHHRRPHHKADGSRDYAADILAA